ncbi:hypothetical protein HNV11_19780 [Spirosoma taeanense]|uniref:Uncharacterized protein n=1 Tax=Spirosoma taeanense TaxID=2735870 RepID=A0A6M5YBD8_9BACT|nr:hypothetical protein [Spirosoma taeanense]QJW91458.1 hypothetical protein HNV11_19780 [Spirosoma taeanense]
MENNANLSDGARQADNVSSEHAETMFSADQAETNMVKLVDGKLVPIGDTDADVSDDMPRIRVGSDEERALQGDDKKKYENSDAALRAGTMFDPSVMPDDPIAVGDITGNPDAGATVNTGLPSEDEPNGRTEQRNDATPTTTFGLWQVANGSYVPSVVYPSGDMIPPTPGTPGDPTQPVPGIPETPPYNPDPGPEIPDLPGTPQPKQPEIQEPDQPDRSHEINARSVRQAGESALNFVTFTAGPPMPPSSADDLIPGAAVPGNQYQGLAAAPDDQGMEVKPDTGDSARPYDVNAKDADEYQPGERPEEGQEAQQLPREMMDESSVTAQDMIQGNDRSDQKSTEGLDRKYNDPEAAREMAT